MGGGKCFMRWEDRIDCELPRGHVGVHVNSTQKHCWWGQVAFDFKAPPPTDKAAEVPSVRPIAPAWADETNSQLWAAWGDVADAEPESRPLRPAAPVRKGSNALAGVAVTCLLIGAVLFFVGAGLRTDVGASLTAVGLVLLPIAAIVFLFEVFR